MRKPRRILEIYRGTDVSSLNTLDKIIPVIREQIELAKGLNLYQVDPGDLYKISVPVYFANYKFLRTWMAESLHTINRYGNDQHTGYINTSNLTPGYSVNGADVRLLSWLEQNSHDVDLAIFYGSINNMLRNIEEAMSKVNDEFFKNYYDQRLASALQDISMIIFTINEVIVFHEWRR